MSDARTGQRRDHAGIAIAVAAFHAAAIGLLLTWRLAVLPPAETRDMVLIHIREAPPPPAEDKGSPGPPRAAPAATPRAPATPDPPPPAEPAPSAQPITAAPSPAPATVPASADGGAGTGAASSGKGSGGGGAGRYGGGGGGGGGSRPRWVSGIIRDSDYPRAASRARAGGTVIVHFDVLPDGRTSHCRVATSSGNPDLDRTTCRLVEQRFRYAPATDAAGRPITDVAGWKQTWWLERP